MDVEIFALCDFAQDVSGKLTIIGAFDTIFARELPVRHPLLCVALRMRFPVYQLGDHDICISLQNQDGDNVIPPFSGKLSVNGIGNDSGLADLAVHLNGIQFEREERLRAQLTVDGTDMASVPLYVRKMPAGK